MNSITSRASFLLLFLILLLISSQSYALELQDTPPPSNETGTVSLPPEAFSISDGYSKVFDGKLSAHPSVELSPTYLLPGDSISVSYQKANFSTKYVGENKVITISGLSLSGNGSEHYVLSDPAMTLTASGEILPILPNVQGNATLKAGGDPYDLSELISGYAKGALLFDIEGDCAGATISSSVLTPGSKAAQFRLKVTILEKDLNRDGVLEYAPGSGSIDVIIEGKDGNSDKPTPLPPPTLPEQPPDEDDSSTSPDGKPTVPEEKQKPQATLSLRGTRTMPYGSTRSLSTLGGSGTGAVHYEVSNLTGAATVDQAGTLTATKAGTISILAKKEGDTNYLPTESEATIFEITPVSLTISAGNLQATVNDSLPSPASAGYTVSGLVGTDQLAANPVLSYASSPNMSQEGSVEILIQGAAVPPGGNYSPTIQYRSGNLTIYPLATFPIHVSSCQNGTITANASTAAYGTVITVTQQGAKGYVLKSISAVTKSGRSISLSKKGDSQYTFPMPKEAITLSAVFENETLPFSDVTERDWFYEDVRYIHQSGLMNGTTETRFDPNTHTTRSMVVTILHRMEGAPPATKPTAFLDVPNTAYYAVPIAWGSENGIVTGTSPTLFSPEAPVTREQFATILYRYGKLNGYDMTPRVDLGKFQDSAHIESYAKEALSWCHAVGLLNGITETTLDPNGLAERAQIAAIFHRFCTRLNPS